VAASLLINAWKMRSDVERDRSTSFVAAIISRDAGFGRISRRRKRGDCQGSSGILFEHISLSSPTKVREELYFHVGNVNLAQSMQTSRNWTNLMGASVSEFQASNLPSFDAQAKSKLKL